MILKKIIKLSPTKFCLLLAIFVGVVFYAVVDPEDTRCLICPFKYLTGLKCPGCGAQRAFHHLLHFEFLESFKDNALFVVMIPILCIIFILESSDIKLPKIKNAVNSNLFRLIIISILLIWVIIRNCVNLSAG